MAYFDTTNPHFTENIRKLEPTDPGHADLFNEVYQAIISNVMALKAECESKIIVGPEGTGIPVGGLLFVVDGEIPTTFTNAEITNIEFGENAPPGDVDNWGRISGKLTVSEEPEHDTTFFAKIINESEKEK